MGLFSSKKEYVAYAASSPLFDEIPKTLKSNILQSNITGATKAGAVMYTINTDQFARAKAMFRYAARYDDPTKEGGYIRGFPTANMNLVSVDPSEVEAALTRAVGANDGILEMYKGNWSEDYFLAKRIQATYNNPAYFPWGATPPTSTHWDGEMESVQIPVINPDTGEYYTSSNLFQFARYVPFVRDDEDFLYDIYGPDAYAVATPEETDEYEISFPYVDNTGTDRVWTVPKRYDVEDVVNASWIMAVYSVGEQYFYWNYEIGSGVDPILESAITEAVKDGSFLPVAVLMQDQKWFDEDPESELAITTNKLMKRLATSGTKVREDFQEQEEEDNASGDAEKANAEKWDFFIHYAVPIDTKVRGSLEYLWNFFSEMKDWSTETSNDYYNYLATANGKGYSSAQPINELVITEAGVNGYNVAYRWSFIEKIEQAGSFEITDPIDGVRPLKPKEVTAELVQLTETTSPEYQAIVDEFFGPGTPVGQWADPTKNGDKGKAKKEAAGYHDFYVITRALPDPSPYVSGVPRVSPGYERILVMGLSMQYVINTSDVDEGKKGYRFRYATPLLFGLDEETKEFRIPLLYSALHAMPVLHREEACADGLTGTVFLVQVIKTKWYQSGFFKWLLIIIAIVLIVISIWFPYLIQGAITLFGAALGGGGFAMFVAFVVISFAIGYMIALGTSLMSPKMQMILAVVIIVAMIYTGQFQNIKQSFSAFKSAPGWGSAATLVNAVSPIYNMGFSVYSQYTMGKYEDQFRDLMLDARERQEKLEEAWAALGPPPVGIDPLDLIQSFERAGATEMPDSYFVRVLEPNPGILGYDMVNNWAEYATVLPKEAGPGPVDYLIHKFEEQRG